MRRPPKCSKCCGIAAKDCQKCTASPCYIATGNYTTSVVDLQVSAVGPPLTASRTYESGNLGDGIIGIGWSLNLAGRLTYARYLLATPSTYRGEATIDLPTSARVTFTENPDGTFTPPSPQDGTLVRNADSSYVLTATDGGAKYRFASTGAITSVEDAYGNAVSFNYDAGSRLSRVADVSGSGRYLDITYGADGRVSIIADHTGRNVQFSYNLDGTLSTVINPLGQQTSYTYTVVRLGPLLTRTTDHWGRVITDITYDDGGRTATYTELGETYTYTYNYQGRTDQTSKADSAGNRWIYTYNSAGFIGDRTYPDGQAQHDLYNADGSIAQTTDEAGVITAYSYDASGRVTAVTRDYQGPSAIRFDYAYDPNFATKVTSITPKNPGTGAYDPTWQAMRYDYCQAGSSAPGALWHVYRVHDDGITADTIATYIYDAKGRVTSVADATGSLTNYTYDTTGNLATVTSPANNDAGTRSVTTYGYDSLGRVTSVVDPLTKSTTYTYDALDRVATVTLSKPSPGSTLNFITTYTYDQYDAGTGLLSARVTDPNNITTTQSYDVFGRLRKSTDAAGNATTYAYTRDMLTSITDANNNTTTYQYDSRRRLTRTLFADGSSESYTYYPDGLLSTKAYPRVYNTFTYEYDHLKRLTAKRDPTTGTAITYVYTGQKLTRIDDTMASPTETHTFTYDSSFRRASDNQATRGTLSYTYDAADRPATYSVSGGGPTATYAYYADGSLNTITWSPVSGTFKYAYTPRGQYESITFPSGQARNFAYDDQGRLLQLANTHPAVGNLATFSYGYDLDYTTSTYIRLGQRTSMTADVPSQSWSGALTKYYFDTGYQLTRADYPSAAPFNGDVASWAYDGIGNRTSATTNGSTTTYTYQKIGSNPLNWQRLLSAGATSYTYDANGNTSTMGSSTLGWDRENRLISITGGATATYAYDYQGRRSSKTASAATSTFLYDGLNLVRETVAITTDYLFGPGIDEPLAISRAATPYYFTADGLGSVATVNDVDGIPQNRYTYDTWGMPRSSTEAVPQQFRYTGRELGDLTSQWFYRARYYQADVGRLLSEDPLARLGDVEHVYDYAYNDPAAFGDPLGLFGVDKNCDYWGCIQKFIDEVNQECAKKANYITDPRLRRCVQNRCNGTRGFQTFKCGNCSDPNAGMSTAYGSRVTTICVNNLSSNPNAIPAGYFGEAAIHEMAHGCNWYHGRNWTNGRGPGDGVPRDFGPDNPPNKYGEPPNQILRR